MKSDKFYKVINKVSEVFSSILENFLKAYLNTVVGQGFLKRVINFLVDKMFDEVVEPLMKIAVVRIGYNYDVREGKRLITKLNEAKENNDEDAYNSTVDDILS